MREALALFAIAALIGCKSRGEVRPAPERVDAAPDVPQVATGTRILRGGEVIDVAGERVTRVVRDSPPISEVNDETRAFLFDTDGMLRAFELTDGKEAWSRTISTTRRPLLIDLAFVYVVGESQVTIVAKHSGDARTIAVSKPIVRATTANGLLVVARNDRVVEVFDPRDTTGRGVSALTLPFDPIGHRATLETLADRVTVCAIASDGRLQVFCFATNGTARARATVDLRTPTAPPGATFTIVSVDTRYVLFAAHSTSAVRRSAVVRLSDGVTVARVEDDVAAIVEREDGSIDGLLVVDPELRLLDMAGAVRWTAKRSVGHHESASAITREKTVFIATFPEFSSGSDLSAYDVATGARVWKGVVERLSIGHSEYFNEVRLSIVDNRLVLRGDESAIVTTQVFDLANGNRQFASSHHR